MRRAKLQGVVRGDRGALTLSYMIIVPVFLLAIMVIVQASIWYLARETALAAARQGADVARTAHPPPGTGAQVAVAFARSAAPGFLIAPAASAAGSSAVTVRIRVTGRVPSLVPWLKLNVSEVVTAPVERFTASGGEPGSVVLFARLQGAFARPSGSLCSWLARLQGAFARSLPSSLCSWLARLQGAFARSLPSSPKPGSSVQGPPRPSGSLTLKAAVTSGR